MKTNRIPQKISPDNLVDTYIELQFSTDWNKDYLVKQVTQNLHWDKIPMQSPSGKERYFFTDGLMRFYVSDKCIGTNCVGSYIGWTKYYANIKRILAPIKDKVAFNAVKLNYISHWPETEIFEHLDGELHLNQFEKLFNVTSLEFPAQWKSDNIQAHANVKVIQNIPIDNVLNSVIDITVLATDLKVCVEDVLNELHNAQKDMFFKLLSKDFVDSLNPIW